MQYDSQEETQRHIDNVRMFMNSIIKRLCMQAKDHDASKLEDPEKSVFDEWTPMLSGVTYGSDEYRDMLKQMKPAIDHHQSNNRHHPEYFGSAGVEGMDLLDLVEMVCDWKAATMRHDDGDIRRSIDINAKRFQMPDYLVGLLRRTVANMHWE